jgi:hypothetical protein
MRFSRCKIVVICFWLAIFQDALGDVSSFEFDHFGSQLRGQLKIIDQVPLFVECKSYRCFPWAFLYTKTYHFAVVIGREPRSFPDHNLRGFIIAADARPTTVLVAMRYSSALHSLLS